MKDIFRISELLDLDTITEDTFFEVKEKYKGLEYRQVKEFIGKNVLLYDFESGTNRFKKKTFTFKIKDADDKNAKTYYTVTASKGIVGMLIKFFNVIKDKGIPSSNINEDSPLECNIYQAKHFLMLK